MNTRMNDEQVASYMQLLNNRIKAYQQDWSAAEAVTADEWATISHHIIKATKYALDDFMDVLNND